MISTRRTETVPRSPTVRPQYLVVSMLVIVVEDVVVPLASAVLLDCDAMPDDRLADLLLVRVQQPQLMVIFGYISKAVRQYRGAKDISGLSTVLEIC